VSIAAVAAVYVATLCLLEKRGFWVVDNANKFLQVQAIIGGGYREYSLPWPGAKLDPQFQFNPLPSPFSAVRNGKLYSIFPPFFAAASTLPYRAFGVWGLYVLPAVCGVVMLAGLARLAGLLGFGPPARHAAVLVAGLCTPVWFYSVTFWEHVPAVCLCVWAVCGYVRFLRGGSLRHLIAGSAAAAFGVYFRDELYLFCLVLLAAALLYARGRRTKAALAALGAMAVSIVPLWLFQWQALGSPFGFHLGTHALGAGGLLEHLAARPMAAYMLFAAAGSSVGLSVVLAAPFLAGFLINPRLPRRAHGVVVPLACLAAVASAALALKGYYTPGSPIEWMLLSNSLFTGAPVLILAFLGLKRPPQAGGTGWLSKWVWGLALGYAVVYALATPGRPTTGVHWGNRFLLVLYPLLGLLAGANLLEALGSFKQLARRPVAAVALVVLVSLAAQANSIRLLAKKKQVSFRLNEAIRKRPEGAVISRVWWAPQEMFSCFYTKSMFFAPTPEDYGVLLGRLSLAGYRRHLFVDGPFAQPRPRSVARLPDDGLGAYSLEFLVGEVPPPASPNGGAVRRQE